MNEDRDFSLVLGGPLYQLWLRTRMVRTPLDLQRRRVVVLSLVAWLPLFALSILDGRAWPGSIGVPFVYDVAAHARFLLAMPLLVLAESIVHRRIAPVVEAFTARGIVPDAEVPAFRRALALALRIRNSVVVEALLLAFVLVAGHSIWRSHAAPTGATWYATPSGDEVRLTLAGSWYVYAGLPLFQFLVARWLLRIGIWIFLLARIRGLDLRLTPTHPDRCGGLGFLAGSADAFLPIFAANGAVLGGSIADRIFFEGMRLTDFRYEIAGVAAFSVLVVMGPLLLFSGHLSRARRRGMRGFGALATRYGQEFEAKWLGAAAPTDESLLGHADLQSLADLASGYDIVREMKTIPFGTRALARVAIATVSPMAPLVLTMVPFEAVLKHLVDMVL
jgi:hypothetical protein